MAATYAAKVPEGYMLCVDLGIDLNVLFLKPEKTDRGRWQTPVLMLSREGASLKISHNNRDRKILVSRKSDQNLDSRLPAS